MPEPFDIEYTGWAPCVHHDCDKMKFAAWLNDVSSDVRTDFKPHEGGLLESLLWLLNELGAVPSLPADQWTACICEGLISGKRVKTRIEGDTFLLSVGESYRWWREKVAELTADHPAP